MVLTQNNTLFILYLIHNFHVHSHFRLVKYFIIVLIFYHSSLLALLHLMILFVGFVSCISTIILLILCRLFLQPMDFSISLSMDQIMLFLK